MRAAKKTSSEGARHEGSGTGREAAENVQAALSGASLRVYRNADIIGVEHGGALKNVIAIATGISDGLGRGTNPRAAIEDLMTRALMEE